MRVARELQCVSTSPPVLDFSTLKMLVPDERSAEAEAAKQFQLSAKQRRRLAVQAEDT